MARVTRSTKSPAPKPRKRRIPSEDLGEILVEAIAPSGNDKRSLAIVDPISDEEDHDGENDSRENASIRLESDANDFDPVAESENGDHGQDGNDSQKPIPGEDNIDEMLSEIGKLNLEADRVIKFFLNTFESQADYLETIRNRDSQVFKRFTKLLDGFGDVFRTYTYERYIAGKTIEGVLQVSEAFNPIVQKANIAATTARLAVPWEVGSNILSYMKHGAWFYQFLGDGGCASTNDEDNFEFMTAWRTQIYIMGIEDPPDDPETDEEKWPDSCLFGLFCLNSDLSQPSNISASWQDKLHDALMSGWDLNNKPAPEAYVEKLKAHVRKLRSYTLRKGDNTIVDIEGLREEFPYHDFLVTFHKWLNKFSDKIKRANPKLSDILRIAENNMYDIDKARRELKLLMERGKPEPVVDYPKLPVPQGDRRHTYSFGTTGIYSGRPAPTPRASLPERSHISRNTIRKISEIRRGGVSTSGLRPPRAVQPPKLQPKPQPDFNILTAIAKTKEIDEKENINTTAPANKPTAPKLGRFNAPQPSATKISFSDESEADMQELEEDTTMVDDQQNGPSPTKIKEGRVARKRKAESIDEDDDEDSEHEPLKAPIAPRPPKRRYPGLSANNRIRDFEGRARAAYPNPPERDTSARTGNGHSPPRRGSSLPQRGGDGSSDDSDDSNDDDDDDDDGPARGSGQLNRREWPEEDVKLLKAAIAEQGIKWAVIRDEYFAKRWTNVDCKDKARNMKYNYLQQLRRLPKNFSKVTLGKQYIDRLAKQGIRYIDGDREARRI